MKRIFFLFSLIISCVGLYAQPYYDITHLSGTRNIACTDVTVTTANDVKLNNWTCLFGPYILAQPSPPPITGAVSGSVTFTFNPGVNAVRFYVYAMEINVERVSVFVNGTYVDFSAWPFTPTVLPFTPLCGQPAVSLAEILPSGELTGPPGAIFGVGAADITLTSAMFGGPINSITIADNASSFWYGVLASMSILPYGPVTPVPPITGTTIVCTGSTTNLSNSLAGGTWSSGDVAVATVTGGGVVTGVSAGSVEITYSVAGNCWVTTTVMVGDDTGPCSLCRQMPGVYSTITGGTINSDIAPGYYHVTGNITIAAPFFGSSVTATDAVLFIDPGVHIYVDPYVSLVLKGCHLFSCGGMWEGIELRNDGTVTGSVRAFANASGRPTLIEDATTAIKLDLLFIPFLTPNAIETNNAIFNKNNTAIHIRSYTSLTASGLPGMYDFKVENTIFTSRDFSGTTGWPAVWPRINGAGGLKSPFGSNPYAAPYKLTDAATYPMADCNNDPPVSRRVGILLDKVGRQWMGSYYGMVIGAANTNLFCWGENYQQNIFDNLAVGIHATNSNFISRNNVFCNIVQVLDPQPKWGYGIYTTNTDAGQYSLVVEPSTYASPGCGTTQSTNLFYDCAVAGVYSWGYYVVKGRGATMRSSTQSNAGGSIDQTRNGYEIYSCPFDEVTLTNNTILNIANGIIVGRPFPIVPGPFLPTENRLTIMNNQIRASAVGTTSHSTRYVDKAISVYGIASLGSFSTVAPVTINQNTLADVYNGIYLLDMDEQVSTTNYNTITTRLYPAGAWAGNDQYGIMHEACTGDWTLENTITGDNHAIKTNYWGVKIKGNMAHTVSCNKATAVGTGFEFSDAMGSVWRDNTMTNNQRGFVVSAGSVLGTQGSSWWPAGNMWKTTGSFTWTGVNYSTFTDGATPTNSSMWSNPGMMRPSNNRGSNPTNALTWYGASSSTGNGILATSVLFLNINCLPVRYVAPAVITGVVLSNRIGQRSISYGQHEQQHEWMAQMNLYRALRLYPDFDTESGLATFKKMAAKSRYGILTKIEQQLAEGRPRRAERLLAANALEDGATTTEDEATGVRMADDVAVNNIAANYRRLYELCIRYMDTTMTGDDSTDVEAMAMLCPETEGGAVYRARGLYNLLHHTVRIFSPSCDTVGDTTGSIGAYQQGNEPWNIASVSGEGQLYGLYPNPNNGNFILQQMAVDDKPVDVVIWDAIGRKVYESSIVFTGARVEIRMEHAVSGVYLVQVTDAYKHKQKFKLMVK